VADRYVLFGRKEAFQEVIDMLPEDSDLKPKIEALIDEVEASLYWIKHRRERPDPEKEDK